MRTAPSRKAHPHRQRSRQEKHVRRVVKRAFITATHDLTRFTLDFYAGRFDLLPVVRLAEERKLVVARYQMARTNYVAVFGDAAS